MSRQSCVERNCLSLRVEVEQCCMVFEETLSMSWPQGLLAMTA